MRVPTALLHTESYNNYCHESPYSILYILKVIILQQKVGLLISKSMAVFNTLYNLIQKVNSNVLTKWQDKFNL